MSGPMCKPARREPSAPKRLEAHGFSMVEMLVAILLISIGSLAALALLLIWNG